MGKSLDAHIARFVRGDISFQQFEQGYAQALAQDEHASRHETVVREMFSGVRWGESALLSSQDVQRQMQALAQEKEEATRLLAQLPPITIRLEQKTKRWAALHAALPVVILSA